MSEGAGAVSRSARLGAVTVAVLLAAVTLRSPIAAVAPLARDIEHELGVSASFVGLLSSLPVLCFAIFAILGIVASDRLGPDLTFTLCLIGTVLGGVIRSAGGPTTAIVGTLVIGLFLAVGNVVVPVIISREYSARRATVMAGIYSAMFTVGATSVTFAGAPLAALLGWRLALAGFVLFAVVTLIVWSGTRRRSAYSVAPRQLSTSKGETSAVLRAPSTWLLTGAFAAQGFSYYGTSAWLPSLLASHGFASVAAGTISGIFQGAGIAGALAIPFLVRRVGPVPGVIVVAVLWLTVPMGFLLLPQFWAVWCVLGGIGQGGGLSTVFVMIVTNSRSVQETAARSGVVQGIGYGVAATGPFVVGLVHDTTGGWELPLLVLLVSTVAFGVFGASAGLLGRSAGQTKGLSKFSVM